MKNEKNLKMCQNGVWGEEVNILLSIISLLNNLLPLFPVFSLLKFDKLGSSYVQQLENS